VGKQIVADPVIESAQICCAQKTTSSNKNLCHLWTALYLAQEMGKGLGRSEVLQ
jgi:hypothetical protein